MDVTSTHEFFIATGTVAGDITSMRIWVVLGQMNAAGGTRNADSQTIDWVGFLASSGLSANWQVYAGNSSTNTRNDTAIAYTSNTTYHFMIKMKVTSIDFYINGVPFTISTNLPSTTNALAGQVVIWTLANATKNIRTLLYTTNWP